MTVQPIKRIVVKVGSSLVTNNGDGLDRAAIERWAEQVAMLLQAGIQVLMVSSGAIAEGMQRLGWQLRPTAIHQLQAAAAVGQMGLVQMYERCFKRFNLHSAQVLLTNADLDHPERRANAKATIETLLSLGVVPIINENDTVVTDEIKFGDNDHLAALVVNLIGADLLIILTDQGGLFTADPRQDPTATLVQEAFAGDPQLEKMAGGVGSAISKGGMLTKILAAKTAAQTGASTVIASGHEPQVLNQITQGLPIGSLLKAIN
ncbi:MAG: glutamate 5-kinase [Polynucleobacter sp.]|jgi:glutamate 5-kinase|nr:glutamate 5-kinase [Polynucleobacter sp.]